MRLGQFEGLIQRIKEEILQQQEFIYFLLVSFTH